MRFEFSRVELFDHDLNLLSFLAILIQIKKLVEPKLGSSLYSTGIVPDVLDDLCFMFQAIWPSRSKVMSFCGSSSC